MQNLTASEHYRPAAHRALSARHTTAIALGDPLPTLPYQMRRDYRETGARLLRTRVQRLYTLAQFDPSACHGYLQQEAALIARLAGLAAAYYDATGREIEAGRGVGTVAA